MSERILITRHAAERYIERVKPGLTIDQATRELRALVLIDEPHPEPPDWKADEIREEGELFMEPCDGIAFAVRGRSLMTVLTRAGTDSKTAERRRQRKARNRAKKQSRRRKSHDKYGLPRGRTDEWRQDV